MAQYIDKTALVAEIEKRLYEYSSLKLYDACIEARASELGKLLVFLNTLEVKEVDFESEQRMRECPYRQVGCTMYEGRIFECKGTCSWVVDYPKLKQLKAQKGERV